MEVSVPAVQALDPALVAVSPEPATPARACVDAAGKATVCNSGLADYIEALRAWGRGLAAQVQKIAGLQPKPAP